MFKDEKQGFCSGYEKDIFGLNQRGEIALGNDNLGEPGDEDPNKVKKDDLATVPKFKLTNGQEIDEKTILSLIETSKDSKRIKRDYEHIVNKFGKTSKELADFKKQFGDFLLAHKNQNPNDQGSSDDADENGNTGTKNSAFKEIEKKLDILANALNSLSAKQKESDSQKRVNTFIDGNINGEEIKKEFPIFEIPEAKNILTACVAERVNEIVDALNDDDEVTASDIMHDAAEKAATLLDKVLKTSTSKKTNAKPDGPGSTRLPANEDKNNKDKKIDMSKGSLVERGMATLNRLINNKG